MKRHTLLYICLLLILTASGIVPVQAQQQSNQYALYNYRNDGDFNAWLNIDIDSITYSRIDTLGLEHDDVVVQEVWTPDSLYRIPLEAIDSIGFRAPEPVYKDNIFHIRKYHMPFIQQTEGLTLNIGRGIEKDSLPNVGQIIISDVIEEPLPRGFSGRVLSIKSTQNSYVITCEAVSLTDIFERLLLVGRSESFTPEEIQQARKASPYDTDWDGIIPFEVGKFSVNIPSIEGFVSNSKSDMTLGTLSVTPKFCVSYICDIRPFVHSHVKVLFENKSKVSTELHLKVSGESSVTETKKASVYLTKVPIPLVTGILYGEVAVSGDLYLKGNIDLKATFTKNLYNGDEFEWSTSDFWNINHNRYDKDPQKEKKGDDNDDNEWQSDVTLSVNGSFGFGASLDLVLFAVSENTLEIANTTTVGPELSGSLKFSSDGLKDGTLYSMLKNTNVTFTSLKLSDDVTFNICGREFTLGSFSISSGTKEFKLFPDFEPLSLPQSYTQGDKTNLPLGLYTIVKNDVIPIIPLKLGIGRYDKNDNLLDERFASDLYQYEDEWDNRKLYYDISNLTKGETHIFHPLIRVWGLKALQLKAMPQTVVDIPKLTLASSSLKLAKGDSREITIVEGWGEYKVENLNNSVTSSNIVTHNHPDGSISKGVEIRAIGVGKTEIRVIDKRSQEVAPIMVEVTNDPVYHSTIAVNTKTLDFGDMEEGEVRSEHFTVSNTGDYELKFTIAKASAPFNIPEAGKEFTLAAGGKKEFSVICSGLKSGDGTKTQFISISSDASNASPDFGITLKAKCGTASTSAITVSPTAIDFGAVEYLTSKSKELKVSNTGDKSLMFYVSCQGSEAFSVSDNGKEYTLNPGDFKLFTVTCQGMMQGSDATGEIKVVTTADNGNQSVRLTAQGAAPTTFTLEKNAIDVKVGSVAYVNILYGSENYGISNGNTDIVSVVIDTEGRDNTYGRVKLIAMEVGQSVVKLTDNKTNKTVNLTVTVKDDDSPYITFADAEVERICLSNWDTNGDGKLSKTEAAAVTDLGGVFMYNSKIRSFAEFRYFTGVTTLDLDFYSCFQLRDIVLPRNLENIYWNTFYDCGKLKSIHIPQNVSCIDHLAFQWSSGLESVTVSPANATYDSRGNCNAIIETETNTVNNGFYTTVIPSTVTTIGYYAFWGQDRLTELSLPSSIIEIQDEAFGFCDLKEVTIPSSVVNIGGGAFGGCYKLKSITIASGNSVYDSREGCNAIINSHTNELMQGCQNTVIPSSVTSIADNAFEWQYYLENITIPESVKSIGYYAFYNCSDLEKVYIPSSVTYIGPGAFGGCTDLSEVVVSPQNTTYDSRNNSNAIVETASNTLIHANKYSQIPDDITSVGDNALAGYNANSLSLPEGIISIGNQSFRDSWLRSLTLPSTLEEMGYGAFWECEDLSDVTCYAKDVPYADEFDLGDMTFHVYNATLHVPATSVDSYLSAPYWQDFGNIVALPEGIIKVEPTKIDFGTLARGESKTAHFIVTNTGEGILAVHLDFSGNDVFEVSDPGIPFRLMSGESREFTVTCHLPENAEFSSSSANIWIRSDASNADEYPFVSLDVRCLQNPPSISVTPTEIDFGVLPRGESKTEHFTISNTGGGTLNFLISYAWGGSNSQTTFDISDLGEFNLNSGESKVFTVVCTCPEDAPDDGKYWLRIDLESNASNAHEYDTGIYLYMEPEKRKPDGYAVFKDGVLSFYYDDKKNEREGESFDIIYGKYPGWSDKTSEVSKVVFDPSYANARPKSISGWFSSMRNLTDIEGLHYLNTSEVTNMNMMFYDCSSLKYIDLSNFSTDNAEEMSMMFFLCSSLGEINISHFNTSKVKDMSSMFGFCENLKTIYCGDTWTMSSVINSNEMFKYCFALVGGSGTDYDANHIDGEYARIDGGEESPGYFTDINSTTLVPAEAIDLGLPSGTKWASCNVGATNPEDYGSYFAWGETGPKSSYSWSTYIHSDGSSETCHDIGNDISGTEYDVAHVKWGGDWRMPTSDQIKELIDNCSTTWITVNDVGGLKFTGSNGSSIFLPAAGQYWDEYLKDEGNYLYYWSSTKDFSYFANILYFDTDFTRTLRCSNYSRDCGIPVRPVMAGEPHTPSEIPSEAVDLGLPSGTRWASCNVGATKPEEFGDKYAWGETEEKSDYTEENYLYKGQNLGSNISGTQYDVAHVKWGGNWQMPTKKQMEELESKCTVEKVVVNGVSGVNVIGPNGNVIFFPILYLGRGEDFWSGTPFDDEDKAYSLSVSHHGSTIYRSPRWHEYYVRPVEVSNMIPPILTVFPEDIAFGVVKDGTEKAKTLTVTNTSNASVKVTMDGCTESYSNFDVSDNQEEVTLAPGESKVYTVTAHGTKAGYAPTQSLLVKCEGLDEDIEVKMSSYGDDDDPIIDVTELSLNVGETASVKEKFSGNSSSVIDDESVIELSGGGGPSVHGGPIDRHNPMNNYSESEMTVKALKAGVAHISFTDHHTNHTSVLTVTVTDGSSTEIPAEPIDLGLPSGTLWASCNVGATRPEGIGGRYAWGETEEKTKYGDDNYQHDSQDFGSDISGTEYDVAHVKWGKEWRMPTRDQCRELIDNCTMEQTTINGIDGFRFTGPNGNSVFLPSTGNLPNGMGHAYWSSTAYGDNHAITLRLTGSEAKITGWPRSDGFSVRPVMKGTPPAQSSIIVTPTEIDFGKVELDTDKTETFTVTNTGSVDVSFSVQFWGDCFDVSDTNENITLAPSESKVFTITAHGMKRGSQASCEFAIKVNTEEDIDMPTVKASLTGWDTKPLTLATSSISLERGEEKKVDIVYGSLNYELTSDTPHLFMVNIGSSSSSGGGWYDHYNTTTCFIRIEARATGEKATLRLKDKDTGEEVTLQVNVDAIDVGATAVDLGLPSGTRWANFNVGATKPEEFGGYYAWGETEEKANYNWSTFIHCDGTKDTCHDLGSDIIGTIYDVAHEKWSWSSSSWMMPSVEQFEELVNNCSHEVVTLNNWWEKGIRFTGSNGNSIFMPFTGYRADVSLLGNNHYGCYWLGMAGSSSDRSYYFYIDESGEIKISSTNRCQGLTVRPVFSSAPDPDNQGDL